MLTRGRDLILEGLNCRRRVGPKLYRSWSLPECASQSGTGSRWTEDIANPGIDALEGFASSEAGMMLTKRVVRLAVVVILAG